MLAKEILSFIFRLKLPEDKRNAKLKNKLFIIFYMFFLFVPIIYLTSTLSSLVYPGNTQTNSNFPSGDSQEITTGPENPSASIDQPGKNESLNSFIFQNIYFFIFTVVFAPIIEELVFRKCLIKSNISYFMLVFAFILNSNLNFANLFSESFVEFIASNPLFELIFSLLRALVMYGSFYLFGILLETKLKNFDSKLVSIGKQNLKFFVVLTTLLFALIHLNNQGFVSSGDIFTKFYLIPIIILPQFIGGLQMAYVALKLGLKYAMLYHLIVNLVTMFLPALFLGLVNLSGFPLDNPTEDAILNLSGIALLGIIGLLCSMFIQVVGVIFSYVYTFIEIRKRE